MGLLIYADVIGIGAAIALPAYQNYRIRAQMTQADADAEAVKQDLRNYYLRTHRVPASLAEAGIATSQFACRHPTAPELLELSYRLEPKNMTLTVLVGPTGKLGLLYVPTQAEDGQIAWSCSGLNGMTKEQLPQTCRR
jgi:type II secretory pathway pseudopilin PulG